MKVIYNKLIPVKGFIAINLFGIIFSRKEKKPLEKRTVNHELIHTKQMLETLFVFFYLIYGIHFLIQLVRFRNWKTAYRNVCFEREAYYFQYHENYLKRRRLFYWIKLF